MLNQAKQIIPHIIDQHAEEAAFLWLLRNNAVDAPHYNLNDLAKLDDRVDAHLDGLRIAGDYGWQACCENLQVKESGEVFAATILALEGQALDRINLVYGIVEDAPETINGLISAFGWVEADHLQGKVNGLLVSENPLWRQVGLSACVIHRVDPGKFLEQAIWDGDIQLRARALKAVGELGRVDLKAALLKQLDNDDCNSRFWAAWSAVLIGDRGPALNLLNAEIEENSEFCIEAMQLVLRVVDVQVVKQTLKVLADNPDSVRQAIIGGSYSGDSTYIPWLIRQMNTPKLAKIAGEAFSTLSGVDLAYQDMESELPNGEADGPNDNPDDDDVAMDVDEDLACPDSLLVQQWWQDNKQNFKPDVRYLYGKPCNATQCEWILRNSTQRLRYAAALALALMKPSQALFEVRAIGKRQQKALIL
ncbi:MAG: TIGR02270 family protein [Methylococcales bacterium]